MDDQIAARAVGEGVFLIPEDHARENRSASATRDQVDEAFPAGHEGADAAVGNEVALAVDARLQAQLAGGHDGSRNGALVAVLQLRAAAERSQGEAGHAVGGQVLGERQRKLRLETVHEVAERRQRAFGGFASPLQIADGGGLLLGHVQRPCLLLLR